MLHLQSHQAWSRDLDGVLAKGKIETGCGEGSCCPWQLTVSDESQRGSKIIEASDMQSQQDTGPAHKDREVGQQGRLGEEGWGV